LGQASDPETLVVHKKMMPGNNPEDFKQHYDHGGSLQLHIFLLCYYGILCQGITRTFVCK
jgi:hypothetical protein